MGEPLSKQAVKDKISDLSDWSFKNDKITKEFSFNNFRDAVSFIMRIAFEAEELGHHPEIFNVYNSVEISLTTHDAGDKVTSKDTELATRIESLYNN